MGILKSPAPKLIKAGGIVLVFLMRAANADISHWWHFYILTPWLYIFLLRNTATSLIRNVEVNVASFMLK